MAHSVRKHLRLEVEALIVVAARKPYGAAARLAACSKLIVFLHRVVARY